MKIKAVFNKNDKRQHAYIKYLKKTFPEIIKEENPDMYFVVGGDGAMHHAHKKYGKHGKPFFGKGMGTLNFIMHNITDDFEVISGLLDGTIIPTVIQTEKIKVKVKKKSADKAIVKEAINDVVIGKDIMDYHSFKINSERGSFENFNFRGMGMCISAPLGSTAFNVNNKGKVIPLDSDLWSVTSVVGDFNVNEVLKPQTISIEIKSERQRPSLFVDGTATAIPLEKGDKIKLMKCKYKFKLALLDPKVFYAKRMKLIQKKR